MNPVLILTRNCLDLTKKCVASVKRQTVDTFTIVIDNGSTDGTLEWIGSRVDYFDMADHNAGVSEGWNAGLDRVFTELNFDYALVINNDTVLPPYFYGELLSYDAPFVTGYSTEDMREIGPLFHHERKPLMQGPDFSAFLIRRDCWEKVGRFDERMKLYAGDNDYHVRAHRAGIPLMRAKVPFYHERSSTLKRASVAERREIQSQADADREVFKSIYGCMPWEPGYAELLK